MSEARMELVAALQRAIDAGSSVRVRYFAGSTPGAERVLSPATLTATHLTATPAGQFQVKRFLLEEIELVIDGQPSKRLPVGTSVVFPDMSALGQHVTNLLSSLGWHVVATPLEISVHRRRKNGSPLKASELTMSFTELDTRAECDSEGNLIETTFTRSRPYSVNGIAFSDFAKAQLRMNELVTALTNRSSSS
jgi:hypothetical protein